MILIEYQRCSLPHSYMYIYILYIYLDKYIYYTSQMDTSRVQNATSNNKLSIFNGTLGCLSVNNVLPLAAKSAAFHAGVVVVSVVIIFGSQFENHRMLNVRARVKRLNKCVMLQRHRLSG